MGDKKPFFNRMNHWIEEAAGLSKRTFIQFLIGTTVMAATEAIGTPNISRRESHEVVKKFGARHSEILRMRVQAARESRLSSRAETDYSNYEAYDPEEFSKSTERFWIRPYVSSLCTALWKEETTVDRLISRESKWNPQAISKTGARGLLQLTSIVRDDMISPSDQRGYLRYAEIFSRIPKSAVATIPDRLVKRDVSILCDVPTPEDFRLAIQNLWKKRHDSYASATVGLVFLRSLYEDFERMEESVLKKKASAMLSRIDASDVSKINRMRATDGLEELDYRYVKGPFARSVVYDPGKLVLFHSLAWYNGEEGKKKLHFAIAILA